MLTFSEEVEEMVSTPDSVDTQDSNGRVTSSSTSSGPAPA